VIVKITVVNLLPTSRSEGISKKLAASIKAKISSWSVPIFFLIKKVLTKEKASYNNNTGNLNLKQNF
jgi:surface polysaccharide O-acyltransferase-like enzyme